MTKCEFTQLNNEDIEELKKYLNMLLKNNLISENDRIQKVLSVVHPDKRIITSDISVADYDCATTVLNGYINYLKDNKISDNSVKYALNLQSSSETINQEDTNQNFVNTFACLSNINPEFLSEQIITRVKILSEVVFGVKYDEEKSSVVDNSPLPISISNDYDEKQSDYNKLVSQFESFQCYTQLLNEFEYLLCYAFLLKQYSLELNEINKDDNFRITNQGGKKRKTIRKNFNKNNKTKKFKGGVINIKQFSTFWSWITGKIGDLSGLKPEVVKEFEKAKKDIEYYSENMENLEEKRNEFYKQVDEWNKTNEESREENIRIGNLSIIQQFFMKKKPLIDIETELIGYSVLENNLKKLWLTQRQIYDEIKRLSEELESLESSSSEIILPKNLQTIYNYCKEMQQCFTIVEYKIQLNEENEDCLFIYSKEELDLYNNQIDEILNKGDNKSNQIIILKNQIRIKINQCKSDENKVINNCKIRNKLSLFVNYIISAKFLGKDNIELFLNLCESRLKETYLSKLEPLAKQQAIIPIRVGFAEHSLQTPFKKQSLESYLSQSKFSDNFTVTKEEYENEVMRQKSLLLDNLTNQLIIYRRTIEEKFEGMSEEAERKLDIISESYSSNELFTHIRTNILKMISSGSFLFLNSYGKNPFTQIASSEIGKAIISSNIYSFIVSCAIEDKDKIIPTLDSYFLYIQIIIVIFITPNLLKSIFPTTFDNKAVNYLIVGIQFILILAYIVINFAGFNSTTEDTYFTYNPVSTPQKGNWLGQFGQILDYNIITNIIFDYLPKAMGNNILLAPSYYFKNLIYNNGKTIIFAESLGLLGYSVTGLTANFRSLSKEQNILYKKAVNELKEFVYSESEFDKMVDTFIEMIKNKSNTKEQEDLIVQLSGATEEFKARFTTSLQAMSTTAQVETAKATKEQTDIMRQQLTTQQQQQQQQGTLQPLYKR